MASVISTMVRWGLGFLGRLLLTSLVVFALALALSGDAATIQAGVGAEADYDQQLRQDWGWDRPFVVRYLGWLGQISQFDLGTSVAWNIPVAELVAQRAPVTFALTGFTSLLLLVLAVPVALVLVPRLTTTTGLILTTSLQIFAAIPPFMLGFLLVSLWVLEWQLLPMPAADDPSLRLSSLILPLVALLLPQLAIQVRFLLISLREVESKTFSVAARARGFNRQQNRVWTDLRHALAPAVGVFSLQFLYLVSGTVIIETVFRLNGLGQLIIHLVHQRDEMAVASVSMILILLTISVQQLSVLTINLINRRGRFA